MNQTEEMVLGPYFGGLGDSLQFSSLPEMYHQVNKRVLLWDKTTYRNSEVPDLVWNCNPFISGYSSKNRNAGDTDSFVYKGDTESHIMNIEISHGFPPTNLYPRIYAQPEKILSLADVDICDFGSFSLNFSRKERRKMKEMAISNKFLFVMHSNKVEENVSRLVLQKSIVPLRLNKFTYKRINPRSDQRIFVSSLRQYWNILCSSNSILTVLSGGYHLAAAAKIYNPKLKIVCLVNDFQSRNFLDKKMWKYPGVDYVKI